VHRAGIVVEDYVPHAVADLGGADTYAGRAARKRRVSGGNYHIPVKPGVWSERLTIVAKDIVLGLSRGYTKYVVDFFEMVRAGARVQHRSIGWASLQGVAIRHAQQLDRMAAQVGEVKPLGQICRGRGREQRNGGHGPGTIPATSIQRPRRGDRCQRGSRRRAQPITPTRFVPQLSISSTPPHRPLEQQPLFGCRCRGARTTVQEQQSNAPLQRRFVKPPCEESRRDHSSRRPPDQA
jgi:hypothetical protein